MSARMYAVVNNMINQMTMIRKSFIVGLSVLCLGTFQPSSGQDTTTQKIYTLEQCVDIALKNNPDVKQSGFTMESNRVYTQEARAAMLPNISGGVSRSIYNGKSVDPYTNAFVNKQYTADNYNLSASLVLWHGSSIQNFLKQNSLAYEASKMDLQQAKDQLTINVILDYLAVLNEQEQLKMAQGQVAVTSQQVDRLTLMNKDGAIAPSDLYDMRGQLSNNQLTVLATSNALETARLDLAQLMNIPYSAEMNLAPLESTEPVAYQGTVDDIYAYGLAHLALVKASELHEKSAQKGIRTARGRMLPTLSLSGGLYTNYSSAASSSELIGTTDEATNQYVMINNSKAPVYAPVSSYNKIKVPYGNQWKNNFNSGVSLNLSIPILSGLQARSNVKLAKISERQTAFQRTTVMTQLRQAIERDYLNMKNAYATYRKLVEQVSDYGESFREAKVKFEAGALNAVEFVLVQNNLDQAGLNLIAAKYHYILQTRILDYYQGKLRW